MKIFSTFLPLKNLGVFFTVTAGGEIISMILFLGVPLVFSRYLPKFEAEGRKDKIAGLALVAYLGYSLLSLAVYLPILVFGNRLGILIYRDPAVGHYLAFGVGLQLFLGIFVITFAGFNGLRKMGSSAALGILYLLLQTLGIFLYRHHLGVGVVLRIYLCSLAPTTVVALILFGRSLAVVPTISRSLIRDLLPYWRYAAILGLLAPLFSYLDRMLVGYFLGMASVSLFVVAIKIMGLARTMLGTPLEAIVPEISYFYEKGETAVLGRHLTLAIKLLFFLGCSLTTVLAVSCRWVLLVVATPEYLRVTVPFLILLASLPLIAAYTVIPTAMRATGKISLSLLSDLLYLGSYLIFILILIRPLGLIGVAGAQFIAFAVVLTFNFGYTAPRHTSIRLSGWFFLGTIAASTAIGAVTLLIMTVLPVPPLIKLIVGFLTVGIGFFFLFRSGVILSTEERAYLARIFKLRSPVIDWLFDLP